MEPYTLTYDQIEALRQLPPGLYLVCSRCRTIQTAGTITWTTDEVFCERCA